MVSGSVAAALSVAASDTDLQCAWLHMFVIGLCGFAVRQQGGLTYGDERCALLEMVSSSL